MASSPEEVSTFSTNTIGDVPAGCWETAEVDPDADFTGVDCIFGYGSLVWKLPCDESLIADAFIGCARGWARRFWQHSVDHRGTPEFPGRVVTILRNDHPDFAKAELDPAIDAGTVGMVYRITDIKKILPELDFREKNGYTRTLVDILDPHDHQKLLSRAIIYYAKPGRDPAYLGPQTTSEIAQVVAKASGPSGKNCEYVVVT